MNLGAIGVAASVDTRAGVLGAQHPSAMARPLWSFAAERVLRDVLLQHPDELAELLVENSETLTEKLIVRQRVSNVLSRQPFVARRNFAPIDARLQTLQFRFNRVSCRRQTARVGRLFQPARS